MKATWPRHGKWFCNWSQTYVAVFKRHMPFSIAAPSFFVGNILSFVEEFEVQPLPCTLYQGGPPSSHIHVGHICSSMCSSQEYLLILPEPVVYSIVLAKRALKWFSWFYCKRSQWKSCFTANLWYLFWFENWKNEDWDTFQILGCGIKYWIKSPLYLFIFGK